MPAGSAEKKKPPLETLTLPVAGPGREPATVCKTCLRNIDLALNRLGNGELA